MTRSSAVPSVLKIVGPPVAVVLLHQIVTGSVGHQETLDPFFHFFGGAAGAYSLLTFIAVVPDLPVIVAANRVAMAIGGVAVAALLWEFGEFLSDRFRGTHIQMGPLDTWSDVALGIAGAVACTVVLRRRAGR